MLEIDTKMIKIGSFCYCIIGRAITTWGAIEKSENKCTKKYSAFLIKI